MAAYFAMRIIDEKLKYTEVVAKYPQFKEQIDLILAIKANYKLKKGVNQ